MNEWLNEYFFLSWSYSDRLTANKRTSRHVNLPSSTAAAQYVNIIQLYIHTPNKIKRTDKRTQTQPPEHKETAISTMHSICVGMVISQQSSFQKSLRILPTMLLPPPIPGFTDKFRIAKTLSKSYWIQAPPSIFIRNINLSNQYLL